MSDSKAMNEQELETDLDHTSEDWLTKELVGFANDLLAYNHRMTEVESPILFIHKYVSKRERRIRPLIQAHTEQVSKRRENEARIDELEDVMGADIRLHTNSLLNKRLETLSKQLSDMEEEKL